MHVRVAHSPRRRRLALSHAITRAIVLFATALAAGVPAGGCARSGPPAADDVRVEWQVTPSPASVGPATVRFSLVDAAGRPVPGARLSVEGHMTHPGMAPVVAEVHETGRGAYEAALSFTMAGDWILIVEGELSDGRRLRRPLSVPGVRAGR